MALRNNPPAGGFQIKVCGKSPAFRVAAKRYQQGEGQPKVIYLTMDFSE
jgi:hypothetical protein